MKDKLIQLGFEKWLQSLDVAPYPVIFWDVPKFIQQTYVQKWLREEYNLRLWISYEVIDDSEVSYVWIIIKDLPEGKGRKKDSWDFIERESSFDERRQMWYPDYEEALEAGLEYAVNLI